MQSERSVNPQRHKRTIIALHLMISKANSEKFIKVSKRDDEAAVAHVLDSTNEAGSKSAGAYTIIEMIMTFILELF